jgi:hypothetical protein
MTGKVTKLLDDFHTITPHLTVRGVADAIAFYCQPSRLARRFPRLSEKRECSQPIVGDENHGCSSQAHS